MHIKPKKVDVLKLFNFIISYKFSDNAWILLKALNYLKLNPICGVTSKDNTVLAISYGQVVVLYDLNNLQMMSALVSKHIQVNKLKTLMKITF